MRGFSAPLCNITNFLARKIVLGINSHKGESKLIIYAIKSDKNLFYNRIHKDFRSLSQNTAFYKTEKNARDELERATFIALTNEYKKTVPYKTGVRCLFYKDAEEYAEQNFNNIQTKVVAIEIKEIL